MQRVMYLVQYTNTSKALLGLNGWSDKCRVQYQRQRYQYDLEKYL